MISTRTVVITACVLVALAPETALAAEGAGMQIVPDWLSIGAGAAGLLIAVLLMVDAVRLRRVAEGSIVADNIAYMMSGVVCFAASVLARWVAIFVSDDAVVAQVGWAADLLVTAGMALLTVYFMRVRRALQQFIEAASEYRKAAEEPSATPDEGREA